MDDRSCAVIVHLEETMHLQFTGGLGVLWEEELTLLRELQAEDVIGMNDVLPDTRGGDVEGVVVTPSEGDIAVPSGDPATGIGLAKYVADGCQHWILQTCNY